MENAHAIMAFKERIAQLNIAPTIAHSQMAHVRITSVFAMKDLPLRTAVSKNVRITVMEMAYVVMVNVIAI